MDRRNFFKIVSAVSAGAANVACERSKDDALIPLLVPDHEVVPGEEQWHPSICTSCSSGCGTIVRVMRGERIIEREGKNFREPIACIKKIEGNPLDSVSGGRLCARGHAVLQSLYNPDRLHGPMRRSGVRGNPTFTPINWDEAIGTVADKVAKVRATDANRILFLTSSQAGSRASSIQRFQASLGAPPAATCSIANLALERKAAQLAFGWRGLPRYDLARAHYALGVGADFIGGWASPVFYAREFGHFRQGRPGLRGKLVQAESRMSLTAGSADEWLPIRPGSEPQFLFAVARLLLDAKLSRYAGVIAPGIQESILTADLQELIQATGIHPKRLDRLVHELGNSDAPLVIAGASVPHSNSLDALIAGHYVNLLLGNVGRPGGLLPPQTDLMEPPLNTNVAEALKHAQVLFLDGDNPVYSCPSASSLPGLLAGIDLIVSFGGSIDDSSAHADLILPDHHVLESESAIQQMVGATTVAIAVTSPAVRPLYDTRPLEQTLVNIATKAGLNFTPMTAKTLVESSLHPDDTWDGVVRQGGLWRDESLAPPPKPLIEKLASNAAVFVGDSGQFPLHFQPYVSLQYFDGRDANLPWMQELPDPVSSAMWDLPVEVDPKTAARLNVKTGDWVQVTSPSGILEARAYVHPAALPGVVSMPIGQGHVSYGRYASGRGTNPLAILAPVWDLATNALTLGATRVQLTKLDREAEELIQFSPSDREQGPWGYR